MIKLKRKRIKGHPYWYAVSQKRVNGNLIDEWQVYLGTAEKILRKIQGGGPNSINIKSYEYGKVAAILAINEELGFTDIVDDLTGKKHIDGLTPGDYALVSILGRWAGPLSKRATAKMFKESFIRFCYNIPHKMNAQNILNNLHYLADPDVIDGIFLRLSRRLMDNGINPRVLLWDTTNFSTTIESGGSLPRKGNAKDKRFDRNLVGLGLVVSGDNVPFLHETYPGNVHDAKVFSKMVGRMVERLRALGVDPKSVIVVMDKGNNSEENIEGLLDEMHVVGSLKKDQARELLRVPLERFEDLYVNSKGHRIRGFRTEREIFGRRFTIIVSHNDATEMRQRKTYDRYKSRFLEGMKSIKDKYERRGGRGRPMTQAGAIRKIRELTADNYARVFRYEIGLEPRKLDYWIDDVAERELYESFGKTIMFTDLDELSSREIVELYNSKYRIENDFRLLNNKLAIPLTPMYVRTDESIRAHVFVCVVGLLFLRYFFWRMRDLGRSENDLLEALEGIRVALVSTEDMKGVRMVVEEMSPLQSRIFSRLDMGRFLN